MCWSLRASPTLRVAGIISVALVVIYIAITSLTSSDVTQRHQLQELTLTRQTSTDTQHQHHSTNESRHQSAALTSHPSPGPGNARHHLSLENTFILHAKYRSGSTFTSEFFHQNQDIFYLFEPLHVVEFKQWLLNGVDFVRDVMTCDFDAMNNVANRSWLQYVFCHPSPGVNKCPLKTFNLSQYQTKCRQSPFVAVKLIRIQHVGDLLPLIQLGAKVIQLIRDPRGMIGSRKKYQADYKDLHFLYKEAEKYCRDIAADMEYIQKKLAINDSGIINAYHAIRYEDAVYQTRKTMHELYSFLGTLPDQTVTDWVKEIEMRSSGEAHTLPKITEVALGTSRNHPASVPDMWRKNTTFTEVQIIQKACKHMMRITGYRLIDNHQELTDMTKPMINPFHLEPAEDGR